MAVSLAALMAVGLHFVFQVYLPQYALVSVSMKVVSPTPCGSHAISMPDAAVLPPSRGDSSSAAAVATLVQVKKFKEAHAHTRAFLSGEHPSRYPSMQLCAMQVQRVTHL